MNILFASIVFMLIIVLIKSAFIQKSSRSKKSLYELIVWDFGDTLDRLRDDALEKGAQAINQELGCHVVTEMLRNAIRQEWKSRADQFSLDIIKSIDTIEKEYHYYEEFYRCVLYRLGDRKPSEALLELLIQIQVSPESYELMPGAKDVLEKLKEKGIRQAILSNGFVSTREHIKYLKIEEYFDCIMVSCEEQAAKPDLALYRRLLDCCEINTPEAILFIDDRKEYIDGAARMKMNTLWFQPHATSESDHSREKITSLSQVFDKVVAKEQEYGWLFRLGSSRTLGAYL